VQKKKQNGLKKGGVKTMVVRGTKTKSGANTMVRGTKKTK
jgi:hypothetical protein